MVDDAQAQVVSGVGVSIADDGGSLVYVNDREALCDPPFTVLARVLVRLRFVYWPAPRNVGSPLTDHLQVSEPRVSGDGLLRGQACAQRATRHPSAWLASLR